VTKHLSILIVSLMLSACGEANYPKSYYKQNEVARAEKRAWCEDNPAAAESGNCLNAEDAYQELYVALREKRNLGRQKLARELEAASWVGKCLGPEDINKCRAAYEAKAAPIRDALKHYNAQTQLLLDVLR